MPNSLVRILLQKLDIKKQLLFQHSLYRRALNNLNLCGPRYNLKWIYKTPDILYIWVFGCLVFLTRLQLRNVKHTAYSIAVTLIIHVEAYFQQITASA